MAPRTNTAANHECFIQLYHILQQKISCKRKVDDLRKIKKANGVYIYKSKHYKNLKYFNYNKCKR